MQQKKEDKKAKWLIITVFLDLLLINLSIVAAFFIRFTGSIPQFNFSAYTSLAFYITLIFAVVYYLHDLYDVERHFDFSGTVARVIQANFLGFLITIALSFLFRIFSFPRLVLFLSFIIASAVVPAGRYFITAAFPLELPEETIVVLGENGLAGRIINEIRERAYLGLRFSGNASVEEVLEKGLPPADRYIVTQEVSPEIIKKLIELAGEARIQIVPGSYEVFIGRVDFETLADIPLIDVGRSPDSSWAKFGKRMFDAVFSLVFLVLLIPLFALVAVLIKIDSRGPVFYLQERVGLRRKTFRCIKFRTMVADAEKYTGPVLAGENDTRITRVGKWLRKYRIDEFPQLINILKGEMSFVGPRPERPVFVEEFERTVPFYRERFKVRPGATGLAQIYGRYGTDPATKLKYDLIYIYNLSFLLDMLIIFRSISVILTGKGAR